MQFPPASFEPDDQIESDEARVVSSPSETPSGENGDVREMQGPLPEPEPVRTAAEILGCGFWTLSGEGPTLQISERGLFLLGVSEQPNETRADFRGVLVESDAESLSGHLIGGVRFEKIVESVSGRTVLIVGWPEQGYRSRVVGTINAVPQQTSEPAPQQDSLLVEAVEVGVESMLVLRAVRGQEGVPVDFEVAEVNSRAAQMLGQPRQDAVGRLLSQLIPETRGNGLIEEYASVMIQGKPVEREYHASPGGFQQIWIRQRVVPLSDGVAVFSNDVTGSRRAGESVDRSRRMFERIASTTPDILLLWDAQTRRFLYHNRTLDVLVGKSTLKSISGIAAQMVAEDRAKLEEYVESLLKTQDDRVLEETFRFIGPAGSLRFFLFRTSAFERTSDGRPQTFLTTAQDVTQQISHSSDLEAKMRELADARAQLEVRHDELESLNLQLSELASTDGLTEIKNRRAFEEKFDEEVERAQRYSSRLALLMADVDHFKIYNDKYGHPAGDQALKGFAQVLSEVCRKSDTIARYGGEEFAIILPNTGAEEAGRLGDRIRASLSDTLYGRQGVTASIGCSEFSAGKEGKERLRNDADRALYQSKDAGRDRVTILKD